MDKKSILGALIIALGFYSLSGSAFSQVDIIKSDVPVIRSILPGSVGVGNKVTIFGSGFTAEGNEVHIGIGGVYGNVGLKPGPILEFTVPGSVGGCDFPNPGQYYCTQVIQLITEGKYEIYVKNANGISNSIILEVVKGSVVTDSPPPTPCIGLRGCTTPLPTPTPFPCLGTSPCSTPAPSPTPRLYSLAEIYDGDIIRAEDDFRVWIVKRVEERRFKRLVFGPRIFDIYGHLNFSKVKLVTKETLNAFEISNLVRVGSSQRVYNILNFRPGIGADIEWISSIELFLRRGYDFAGVFVVNLREFNLYSLISTIPIR